jgi:hypothetical protein
MANTKRFSPRQLEQLAESRRIIAEAKTTSQQPRFDVKSEGDFFTSTMKWGKEAFETIPLYSADSRLRSKWLDAFWKNEPYLAGVINSVVQISRNRGWSLIGGRNQVLRFTDILHNWQVQPGRASWREGVGAMAQAFYTTDIGGLAEVGRQFKGGPMAGMYHLDPTRCVLSSKIAAPLKYHPRTGRVIEFTPSDYMRTASQISIDESYNALGYSALSRCMELAITMVAIWRHEQELLFARAPKGLLLLKGITMQNWTNAMKVRDATLDARQQEWFGAVAVLASSGMDDVDAKLVALSQLPENFDQKTFTDLLMYGYSLAFGYDAREFWPVSSGSLGTATESVVQHRKATDKGGAEFHLNLQEELQGNLPDTIHFEFDERSVDGDMAEAALQQTQVAVINSMTDLSAEQRLTLMAEAGIIPSEWAVGGADTEATDTEDADSPGNENDEVAPEEAPAPADEAAQMLELPEVQRALYAFPDEPLSIYRWNGRSGRIHELPVMRKNKTIHPIAQIMARLAAEVEKTDDKLPQRIVIEQIAPAPMFQAPGIDNETVLERVRGWFDELRGKLTPQPASQPVNVTVNNHPGEPPVVNVQAAQAPDVTVNVAPTQVTNEIKLPETQPQPVTVNVSPTPVTVENTVNIPKQPAPVVNIHQSKTAVERKALADAVKKITDEK